jgi:hypothetical protein
MTAARPAFLDALKAAADEAEIAEKRFRRRGSAPSSRGGPLTAGPFNQGATGVARGKSCVHGFILGRVAVAFSPATGRIGSQRDAGILFPVNDRAAPAAEVEGGVLRFGPAAVAMRFPAGAGTRIIGDRPPTGERRGRKNQGRKYHQSINCSHFFTPVLTARTGDETGHY